MDALISAAARALAAGDPLGALTRVALRDDAPALALRGIAMAQLGDLTRARELLRRAARAFGPREVVARARCVVAEVEVAFAARELGWSTQALDSARRTLESRGDPVNAMHARYLAVRRLLLIGRIDEAEQELSTIDPARSPSALRATHELIAAGIAMRRVRSVEARDALMRAASAAREARIPALDAEVDATLRLLESPVASVIAHGTSQSLLLDEVERLLASRALIVDACRLVVRANGSVVSLATRPILFAIVRALGEAWPGDVSRETLITRAFASHFADESYRARLRVEIARLRRELRALVDIRATTRGFALVAAADVDVVVLRPPVNDAHAPVLALLADGEAWSSSALALALGTSQRTVQRALDALASGGKVTSYGKGRARRWITPPVPGFTTTLLLPAPLPSD